MLRSPKTRSRTSRSLSLTRRTDRLCATRSCINGTSPSRFVPFLIEIACAPKLSYFPFPSQLYAVVVCCSMAAAVQGMDESVTNGANLFWAPQ